MPEYDLHKWTDEDLEAEILRLLPQEQTLSCLQKGSALWEASFIGPDEDILWHDEDFSRRGVLFKAYHQVWEPPSAQQEEAWAPLRERPTLKAVAQHLSEQFADPEDLDPEAILSVYSNRDDNPTRWGRR